MKKIISCILLILIISINKPLKALNPITTEQNLILADINLTKPEMNDIIVGIITTYISSIAIKYSYDIISYTINKYIEAIKAFCNATAIPINKILSPFTKMVNPNQAIKIKLNQKINSESNVELNHDIEINPIKIDSIKKSFLDYLNEGCIKSLQAIFITFAIILAINETVFLLSDSEESALKLLISDMSYLLSQNFSFLDRIKKAGIDLLVFFVLSIKKTNNIILKPFIKIYSELKQKNSFIHFLHSLCKYIKTKYTANQNKNIFISSQYDICQYDLDIQHFKDYLERLNKTKI